MSKSRLLFFLLVVFSGMPKAQSSGSYYIVDVSPDETMIAVLSTNQILEIIETTTGLTILSLSGLPSVDFPATGAIAWSRDSQYLATVSLDSTARIWCINQSATLTCNPGEVIQELPLEGFSYALDWSQENKLAVGSEGPSTSFWLWNVMDSTSLLKSEVWDVYSLAWHPSSERLALAFVEGIYILDVESDYSFQTNFRLPSESDGGWVSVAWSIDGDLLAGGNEDGKVYILDPTDGTFIKELAHHEIDVFALAWSPDGTKLASSDANGNIVIWDIQTGEAYPVDTTGITVASASIDWTATTGLVFGFNENVVGFGSNSAPIANAGEEQTASVLNGTVNFTLNGSGSSDDVAIVSYIWTDSTGAQVATGASPTVDLPVGVHTLTLTVTDDDGATASDDVEITVVGE